MKRAPPTSGDATWLWDVVERSRGGHERSRRLMTPLTADEAREWGEHRSVILRRVDDSRRPADLTSRMRAHAPGMHRPEGDAG